MLSGMRTMTPADATQSDLLAQFIDGTIDPAGFGHDEHIAIARSLLDRYPFLEAVQIYDACIGAIAERAGFAEKRSVTKTLAFMSLIAETGSAPGKAVLERWYSQERLNSAQARDRFLMPDRFLNDGRLGAAGAFCASGPVLLAYDLCRFWLRAVIQATTEAVRRGSRDRFVNCS